MKQASLLILAVFTLWAARVVSRDMATRKVLNSSILTGLKLYGAALGALVLLSCLQYYGLASGFPVPRFYSAVAAHMFLSLLAGCLLWYAEIWPAGDAKFFIVLSSVLPLVLPGLRHFPGLLFLTALVNIFVAAAFWAVGSYLASGFYAASPLEFFLEIRSSLKKRLGSLGGQGWAVGATLFGLVFIFLMQQVMGQALRGVLSRIISMVDVLYFFIFVLWEKVGRLFRKRWWNAAALLSCFLYCAWGYWHFPERLTAMLLASLVNVGKFSLLLFFGRFMLEYLLEKKDIVKVLPDELEPGMVLASGERAWIEKTKEFGDAFEDSFRDGISGEQAGLLRTWLKKLPPGSTLNVVRGKPFALWIAVGAALTLWFNGGVLHIFK